MQNKMEFSIILYKYSHDTSLEWHAANHEYFNCRFDAHYCVLFEYNKIALLFTIIQPIILQ